MIKSDPKPEPGIAGYVKIGTKTEKGYPTSLDHFIIECKFPSLAQLVEQYQKTNSINVYFLYEDWASSYWELRNKSGKLLGWGGDGDKFVILKEDQEYVEVQAYKGFMREMEDKLNGKWVKTFRLEFMIEGIPIYGRFVFKTHGSKVIIPNLIDSIEYAKSLPGGITAHKFLLAVKKKTGGSKIYPEVGIFPLSTL